MNKLIIAILSFFMIISFTSMASAGGPFTSASTGAAITFTSAADPGPGMDFTPSPSTKMSAFTSATAFAAIAASGKTTKSNGIEYGVQSTDNKMYQMTQAGDNAVTSCTAVTLSSSFKDKAGSPATGS